MGKAFFEPPKDLLGASTGNIFNILDSFTPEIPKPDKPPDPPVIPEPQTEDIRRGRGRAATLLTRQSSLSDTQTLRPTLLGR